MCIRDSGVSVKSMAVLESDEQLRLLIASSDGYIKLYDVDVEVCNLENFFFYSQLCQQYLVSFDCST